MAIQADSDNWFRQDNFSARVALQDEDGSVVVALAGEFDLATAEDLRECLVRSEVVEAPQVLVDLKAVTFLDFSSVGLLVSACRRVRSTGGTFSVSCGEGMAGRILEVSGFVDYLDVESTARSHRCLPFDS
jgi:anti-sigma B factor antagonist